VAFLTSPLRVLERRAGDHRRVDDAGFDEVLVGAGLDVEPVALGAAADRVDDDGALEARVVRELADRLLERPDDDRGAGALVGDRERVQLDRLDRVRLDRQFDLGTREEHQLIVSVRNDAAHRELSDPSSSLQAIEVAERMLERLVVLVENQSG
jgi:hypothetical protein